MSGVMMQFFHWYLPNDGTLWREAARRAADLAGAGITAMWLPPAYKGHVGGYDVGYGVYDMFDLGEFDQKGTVRTKYGTKDEYLAAIDALQAAGIAVYADVVWNHRLGADGAQRLWATPYSTFDRSQPAGPTREVEVWTRFDFAGRAGKYHPMTLDASHFDAVDFDDLAPEQYNTIYLFEGKHFDHQVSLDYGNFAYLMGCDVDHSNAAVREMIMDWGRWYLDTTGVDGLRLDAVKHLPAWVLPLYLDAMREHSGRELPTVAEYWSQDVWVLHGFLASVGDRMMLFDVPLHYNFHRASRAGNSFDLRQIFHDSLVSHRHDMAVTFVDNHDSQPMQALESPVDDWFKPLAYALVLLRRDGFPCVFAADYYGASYTEQRWGEEPVDIEMTSFRPFLDVCLGLRRELGDAQQVDLFDHPNVIGWLRRTPELVLVVVMSNGAEGVKSFQTDLAGAKFTEASRAIVEPIVSGTDGWAQFPCPAGGVALWVARPAASQRLRPAAAVADLGAAAATTGDALDVGAEVAGASRGSDGSGEQHDDDRHAQGDAVDDEYGDGVAGDQA